MKELHVYLIVRFLLDSKIKRKFENLCFLKNNKK
jgi:hypothetical protein